MKNRLWVIFVVCAVLVSSTGLGLVRAENAVSVAHPEEAGEIISNGPYGGAILQLMNEPDNAAGLYAAVRGVGLFYSDDRGESWNFLFSGIGPIGNFAIDAGNSNVLYATREGEGLYRSSDKGSTWTAIPLSPDFSHVYTVRAFAHPTISGTVYATIHYGNQDFECRDQCGIYKSTNSGDTWARVSSGIPPEAKINAIAYGPDPIVMYAAADDGALYLSINGGETWAPTGQPLEHASKLVYIDSNLFVIRSGEGVSLPTVRCTVSLADSSLDCLNNVTSDLDDLNYLVIDPPSDISGGANTVTDLKANPGDSNDLLVSTGYRVARSADGGATWTFYDHTSSPSQSSAVLFDPGLSDNIFAGNDQGVWLTTQADADYSTATWAERDHQLAGVVPNYIVTAPSDPLVVYVNSNSGMYRTADGSATWERLPTFCEGEWCYLLDTPFAVDPTDADKLVLAAWQQTVHLSGDGGQTWTISSELPQPVTLPALAPGNKYVISIHALIAVPGDPATYLAAVAFHHPDNPDYKRYAGGGVYKSVDGGANWTLQFESSTRSISSLAYDPTHPERVYAGFCWLASEGACADGGMLTTDDRGDSWKTLLTLDDGELKSAMDASVITICPTDGRLYVAKGSALIEYDSAENIWKEIGGVPGGSPINQLLFDPSPAKAGRVLYAATPAGLYVSEIGVEDFIPFEGDLGYTNTTAMASARNAAGQSFIFVGAAGGQFSSNGINSIESVSIQAETLVKAGVYMTTMVLPFMSGREATSSAAAMAAPEEMPHGIPSIRAALRAVSKAVSLPIVMTSSISPLSRLPGMKPAPMP